MLQVCRAIIHNESVLGNDSDKFRDQLADYKIVLPTADLLSGDDPDVVREALAFLVKILEGGHDGAQKNFIDHFQYSKEEPFFEVVFARLSKSIEEIREVPRYYFSVN